MNDRDNVLARLPNVPRLNAADEAVLHRRLHNGDRTAATELVERTLPWIAKVAGKYRSIPLDEAVQIATLHVLKSIDRWDPSRGSFTNWSHYMVRGVLSRYRGRLDGDPKPIGETPVSDWREASPERSAEIADEFEAADEILTQINGRHAAVIRATAAGETQVEIGDRLGISRARVGQLQKQARRRFDREWKKRQTPEGN